MSIEAVIWDFGGVFTSSPFEAFARYEAEKGLPKDLIRKINSTNPDTNAWALFERNEINTAEFDRLFLEESTALGHPIRGADVLPKLSGELRPRMVAALKTCKAAGFKVGCITNNVVSEHSPGQDGAQKAAGACRRARAVHRHVARASFQGGDERGHGPRRLLRHHTDARTGMDTTLGEHARHAVGRGLEFAVGHVFRAHGQGGRVRATVGGAGEQILETPGLRHRRATERARSNTLPACASSSADGGMSSTNTSAPWSRYRETTDATRS